MNPDNHNDIAALIGSRICHDLVNPVGAIGNGVELLGMTGTGPEELALIADSVALAQARIALFRLAFGAAAPDARIRGGEVATILAAPETGGKTHIACALPDDLPRPEAKLAALVVMCCQSAMPRGGQIALQATQDAFEIEATATRLQTDTPPWAALAAGQPMPPLIPAQVHFALVSPLLVETGRQLRLASGDGWLRLSF
ncbi:MAG: hypothetical protein JJT95_17180 [Pararhodobacter sp.]|nr:hypothetical protein [Pararhodobacter sp.]